ncbi:MAG: DUF2207 domain-containing protein [Burkholderiaceae bacterium]|nr:DUF2207 domain-containing protein [Burkholderiaceae bacterium]
MRFVRNRLPRIVLLALLSALLVGPGATATAAEAIERFDAVIEVGDDGELSVSETIVVHAEGQQIRRGIYRDFPLRFKDAEGRLRRVGFELLAVTRDGTAEPHFVRRNDRGLRIYIGDENTLLPPGRHSYRLRYTTSRQVRHLPEHVELFWNVTGNEWAFPIESASAKIHLPDRAAPLRWTGYTGRVGALGTDWRAGLGADGALEFATTRVLAPGEGLSVVAEIPAGLVAAPSGVQAVRHAALDYRRHLLAGLGLAGVLAFYLLAWRAVGRDPPKGVTIPLFHPPEGISPGLAAYVHQWGWRSGWREFTAAAVSLAVKGLVVFEGSADAPMLLRTAIPAPGAPAAGTAEETGAPTLPAGERALLAWLERNGGRVSVDRANGRSVAGALASFKAAIEKENRHRFFRRNRGHFLIGLVLTVATVAAVLYFGDLNEAESALLGGACVASAFAGSVLVRFVRWILAGSRLRTILIVSIHLAVLAWAGFMYLSLRASGAAVSLPSDFGRSLLDLLLENGFPFALVGGFALLNGLFYYLLRAPTVAGRRIMDQLEGFRLYMNTAESARLNLADAPELTTERFERLLPYAIALGVEKPWAEAFEAAFARAHAGEDPRSGYRPAWRHGADWRGRSFASSVSGMVAATQGSFASAVPPPKSSSSGFSGGGSGGGGGGGGGGGW